MTHTIHPKMLEAVARVIDPEAFKPIHSSFYAVAPKGKPREAVKREYEIRMVPRKNKAYKKAEAAILAMWEGLPIEDAPRDGTMLRLLVDYSGEDYGHPLEDSSKPTWTIGFNNFENDGQDVWLFAGWSWQHDEFIQGRGTPISFMFHPFPAQETE